MTKEKRTTKKYAKISEKVKLFLFSEKKRSYQLCYC